MLHKTQPWIDSLRNKFQELFNAFYQRLNARDGDMLAALFAVRVGRGNAAANANANVTTEALLTASGMLIARPGVYSNVFVC